MGQSFLNGSLIFLVLSIGTGTVAARSDERAMRWLLLAACLGNGLVWLRLNAELLNKLTSTLRVH